MELLSTKKGKKGRGVAVRKVDDGTERDSGEGGEDQNFLVTKQLLLRKGVDGINQD